MSRRKLVVFDCWTKGSVHIIRLLESLEAQRIDPVFVHVGSWGDDSGRPASETLSGLAVRDIRGYPGIRSVLDAETPDAVLFLSLDPMVHRAFNRYCRQRRIPTVNLYPGLWSAQNYDELSMDRRDIHLYWRWVASRLTRFTRYVFPVYIWSMLRTGAAPREWWSFVVEVYRKLAGVAMLGAPADAAADYICVYNEHDARHAVGKYGAAADRVVQVGVPDLIKFGGLEGALGRYCDEASEMYPQVVYIGTGKRGTRLRMADSDQYLRHLVETGATLARHDKRLVCKLHYSRADVIAELERGAHPGISVCHDDDFVATLEASCGAIIEPSTAALVPLVMGKPVFLAQYGKLSGLTFGPALQAYPRARSIVSLDDLRWVAAPVESPAGTEDWIRSVAGPLPTAAMPARVVRVIATAMNGGSEPLPAPPA